MIVLHSMRKRESAAHWRRHTADMVNVDSINQKAQNAKNVFMKTGKHRLDIATSARKCGKVSENAQKCKKLSNTYLSRGAIV